MTPDIRLSTPQDLAALDALFARAYPKLLKPDYPPSTLVTALPIISRAQPKLLRSGTYFVALLDDEIVGAGGWTPRNHRGQGEVRHVVTDDRYQRRGIGRRLFESIYGSALRHDIKLLNAQATRTAVPFYQAMGFTPLGPIEVPLRPGITFPAVQMQRRLG